MIPAHVTSAVNGVYEEGMASNLGVITIYNSVMEKLIKAKVAYKQTLLPHFVLTHPANRGGLMVNAFNAHRGGARILGIGADRSRLTHAVATEMSTNAQERERQIGLNQQVIDLSNGMLAPLHGAERWLSLGTSHTTAFCRAVSAGCSTQEVTIADETGRIDEQKIRRDAGFAAMIDEGWEWLCVPDAVSSAFPWWADLTQRALNASNSVPTDQSEMEVAVSIAQFGAIDESKGRVPDWDACMRAAIAGNPPCKAYAGALKDLVQRYGGGAGAPLVKNLELIAKKHGENKTLGEDFIRAVLDIKVGVLDPIPHVRMAMLTTNLTHSKVVDGLCRFVSRSDVAQLSKKPDVLKALEVIVVDQETKYTII